MVSEGFRHEHLYYSEHQLSTAEGVTLHTAKRQYFSGHAHVSAIGSVATPRSRIIYPGALKS